SSRSCRSASSLTSPVVMEEQRQLRCLIAAGGTVGHVAPSLAVAEALRARGVEVTFAGSPDRVEATLVPERGYAFDAFRVAGFPRRPGLRLLRALWLAAAAPAACPSSRGVAPTSCSVAAATSQGRWCSPRGCAGSRRR